MYEKTGHTTRDFKSEITNGHELLWIDDELLHQYPHILECEELATELDVGGTIGGIAFEWIFCPFCGECL